MTEFHCYCECSKCPPPAPSSKPPTLHLTCDSPLSLYLANLEATGPLRRNLDSWYADRSMCCALCVLTPSCWKMNPVGSQRLL